MAIDAGRAVAIGRDVGPGRREIDAAGRFASPGFVDAHSHSDALRGTLQPGSIADIRVFDPEATAHPGSYAEPSVTPVGIDHVLLAGSVVVENGEFTVYATGRCYAPQ